MLLPANIGASAQLLALRVELDVGKMPVVQSFRMAERTIDICEGRDAFMGDCPAARQGGLAVRAARLPGGATSIKHPLGYIATQPWENGEQLWRDSVTKMVNLDGAPIAPEAPQAAGTM